QLILSPKSYSFEMWKETPVPVYLEFYFFNWTNSGDLTNPDKTIRKPNLVELGPYVFRETKRKVILNWHDNNGTVTFLQNKTWHFDPKLSTGSLNDIVTTLNVPAIAAAFVVKKHPPIIKTMLGMTMSLFETSLSIQKTIRELTFDGYEDPLLDLASIVPNSVAPVTIPFDKFGWFYTRNNSASYDGVFNMYTGSRNIQSFGELAKWNYENYTTAYKSSCGRIGGSAGEFFMPVKKKESISLFSTDVCRQLKMPYKEEILVDGIKAFRYWGDEKMLDTSSPSHPDNWCFCNSGKCPPKGVIDVSSCKWNAPAYVSFPHFLHADASYRRSVNGMKPNASIHQMYIDLEQRSGIPLQVEASMQINILIEPHPEYNSMKHLPTLYFPIFWFKQRARVDDKIGSQIHLLNKIFISGYVIFGTVAAFASWSFFWCQFPKRGENET
ncbi:Protein croquemort, partial [Orchesella cincta]